MQVTETDMTDHLPTMSSGNLINRVCNRDFDPSFQRCQRPQTRAISITHDQKSSISKFPLMPLTGCHHRQKVTLSHPHPILLFIFLFITIILSCNPANCLQQSNPPSSVSSDGGSSEIERLDFERVDPPNSPFQTLRVVNHTSPLSSESKLNEPDCDYGWHRFGDKCFNFLGTSSSHTFEEAEYECRKYHRGNLAKVTSEPEQKFVEQLLRGIVIYNNVWLGAKWQPETIDQKSGYYWIDGTPVTYHNKLLSPELIKGNTSMCLAMFMHQQYFGIWTPFNCNYYFHILCERDLRMEASSANWRTATEGVLINLLSSLVSFVILRLTRW